VCICGEERFAHCLQELVVGHPLNLQQRFLEEAGHYSMLFHIEQVQE
jgi:hypothetical protein